ncbi:MAG TPA: isocitrate lyase/phosphoenolpyruvate mutase family protein [Pseudonocardiaceae bacterium]|jgi:2-methylisocitrate lyase-like PEP mutase family enzyme|nr:isocitrate lyase/phosphoenolpyruvate mutase family protein [Pseudonocardiaceae bacterium]
MSTAALAGRAAALRALHQPGRPVVLANIWDAGSARLVEAVGFAAVATSSGAVAESLGFADNEAAPAEQMFAAAARISAAVALPVTVDAEAGYGLPAAELVDRLIAAGAVGCNLEDSDHRAGGLVDPAAHAGWLAEVRAAAERAGVPLVINARIDVFIRSGVTDPGEALALVEPAVERARAYLAAGADCVYPIAAGREAVRRFVAGVDGAPVNAMCTPGGLSPADATAVGVARISVGTALWRAQQEWLTGRLAELSRSR